MGGADGVSTADVGYRDLLLFGESHAPSADGSVLLHLEPSQVRMMLLPSSDTYAVSFLLPCLLHATSHPCPHLNHTYSVTLSRLTRDANPHPHTLAQTLTSIDLSPHR